MLGKTKMKSYLEVEETAKNYHFDASINSVHRSSLLVPEIDGSDVGISFINHFLLKRKNENVTCIITGIDDVGKKIHSKLLRIKDPKVYSINLSKLFECKGSSYNIEFYSSENLFIPFPAVMVNHFSTNFTNTVHAYNRVLNDSFEDESINKHHVREASIDVLVNSEFDTFVNFQAGPFDCQGELDFKLLHEDEEKNLTVELDVKKFGSRKIFLSELFNIDDMKESSFLRVSQPKQLLFYGRLICGIVHRGSKSFSANHSYYDSSSVYEYWPNNKPSHRHYPFFSKFDNIVRIYPTHSPSTLEFNVNLYSTDGVLLVGESIGIMEKGTTLPLECNANELAMGKNINISSISSLELVAVPLEGNTPTRIAHQIVLKDKSFLYSSIQVTLFNQNTFVPKDKKGFFCGKLLITKTHLQTLVLQPMVLHNVIKISMLAFTIKMDC